MKFKGWNLFLSYSEAGDKEARKRGWGFLGYCKDNTQREAKVYRMWRYKDGPPPTAQPVERERKRKKRRRR